MKCPDCGSTELFSTKSSHDITCTKCGKIFEKTLIFFSYGHDRHADIVKRLASTISERSGYTMDIWIDHIKLRDGANWRRDIADGIENSYGVMAFLSKYSMRERGVCLDELAIAISSKHGMIKSVLLEPLDKHGNFISDDCNESFGPPAMVAEYQWADMSDYVKHISNPEDFSKYVNEKSDRIIKMLNSDEIRKYDRELTKLRQQLELPQIQHDSPKFERLLKKEIIKRNWLNKKVTKWLEADDEQRIMILYGNPGSGKSMFSAYFQCHNPRVAAAFACDYQSNEFSNTDDIISWLAYKLSMRIPEYRGRIVSLFSDRFFAPGNGFDRFRKLILEPLNDSINGKHEKMLVIIDAIDEIKTGDLMFFVRDYADQFPAWIRFLVTSRREEEIEDCFDGCASISFEDYAEDIDSDLLAYYKLKLSDVLIDSHDVNAFYERLIKATEGLFAYAEKICENITADIKSGHIKDLETYRLPRGLNALFRNTLNRKTFDYKGLDFRGFWQCPLGMIIASPVPLPISTLKKLMHWGENEYQAFCAPIHTMLQEENNCLMVFHRSFGEWVNTHGAGRYYISYEDGLKDLATKSYEVYKEDIEQMDIFTTLQLTRLLRASRMEEQYAEVAQNHKYIDRMFELENKSFREAEYVEATSISKELITICKYIIKLNNDPANRIKLTKAINALAEINVVECVYDRAIQLYNESLDVCEHLISQDPQNTDYQYNALMPLTGIVVCSEKTSIKDAIITQRKIVKLCEQLVEACPKNNEYKSEQSKAYGMFAKLYRVSERYEESLKYWKKATEIRKQLMEIYPKNIEYLYSFSKAIFGTAEVFELKDDFDGAYKLYEESSKICKQLIEKNPENLEYKHFLTIILDHMAKTSKNKYTKKSFDLYKKAIEIIDQLILSQPKYPNYKHSKSVFLGNLADFYIKTKKENKALELYKESINIDRMLVKRHPQNPNYKNSFSFHLKCAAQIYIAKNDTKLAIELYREKMSVAQWLVKNCKNDRRQIGSLADTYFNLGNLTNNKKYIEKAREVSHRCPDLMICQKILSSQ